LTLWGLLQLAPDEAIAVVSPEFGVQITYAELRRQVRMVADAFAASGIVHGDRVALALPNGIPVLVCFLAASMAGTAAPLDPDYRYDEFVFYLRDTKAKLLVAPPTEAEEARRAATEAGLPILTVSLTGLGTISLSKTPRGPTAIFPDPDQTALLLHTSDSTGRPKRIPISHRNLAVSARSIAEHYQLSTPDVSLCIMPLFQVHGLVASVLATFYSGGTVVVPAKFNALSFWRTVRDYGVTWYSAAPSVHELLLARADSERPTGMETLRFIRSCGAPLAPEHLLKMEQVFGVPVLEAYGMTEAAHQMTSNPLPPASRKPGSVGPATGVDIGIMDETGNLLPVGASGEVVIRGDSVVAGYESNPEANLSSFTNGWFRTGDRGVLDGEGYLTLKAEAENQLERSR
jgi:acyl-CoA synthetase (AMP-forming)/AMP-acid ligase II